MGSFADLIERLVTFYGPLPAPPADPFAYYVWEILGTRTTPGLRDAAMAALRRVPALTPDSLHRMPRGRLEAIVRQCGPLADERIAGLDAGVTVFRRQPHFADRLASPLREAWSAARDLPHLGHAGAVGLLLFAGASLIVPVDDGILRVTTRLGLVPPEPSARLALRAARRALDSELPRGQAERRWAVRYVRHHADSACAAANPHCRVCPLQSECREGRARTAGPV